jgi:hypothetical protein
LGGRQLQERNNKESPSESGTNREPTNFRWEGFLVTLSTYKGFLAVEEYARLLRQFCTEHKSVSQEIRDGPRRFNPIKEVLIDRDTNIF